MLRPTFYQPIELIKQMHGRVLHLGKEMPEKPAEVPIEKWEEFLHRVKFDPDGLWLEYTIELMARKDK